MTASLNVPVTFIAHEHKAAKPKLLSLPLLIILGSPPRNAKALFGTNCDQQLPPVAGKVAGRTISASTIWPGDSPTQTLSERSRWIVPA
jgi:hypothetical protein